MDMYKVQLQESLKSGKWVAGMERKCMMCGSFIPMFTEQNDAVHSGRPYYVDVFEHVCMQDVVTNDAIGAKGINDE